MLLRPPIATRIDTLFPYPSLCRSQKKSQSIADSILVAWNDGRMGNRQTKRMTKQRRHRKPISKAAHHRRLGEGADETHRRMDTHHATRGDVDRGHQDQPASRDYRSDEHTSKLPSIMRNPDTSISKIKH